MFCPKCGCEQEDDARFCIKCGASIFNEPAKKVKKSGGGKAKRVLTTAGTFAALAVVIGITVNMTGEFLSDTNGENTANSNITSAVSDAGSQSVQQSGTNDDAFGREMAKLFAQTYSCEWKVKKYTENGKDWKTYDMGKKMLIVAYNFLNDQTITTGGYNKVVGHTAAGDTIQAGTLCSKCKTGKLYPQTTMSANWVCDFCGHKEYHSNKASVTNQYEWVPSETHEYHGTDIYYDCPQITITADSVDMRGMGGTVYSIDEFRYEVSSDGNDRIVNDEYKFALEYDGRYLNYKQLDEYGYYVGLYEYDTTDRLINITNV